MTLIHISLKKLRHQKATLLTPMILVQHGIQQQMKIHRHQTNVLVQLA